MAAIEEEGQNAAISEAGLLSDVPLACH